MQIRFLFFFWSLAAFVSGDIYFFNRDIRPEILILGASAAALFFPRRKSLFLAVFFISQVLIPWFYLPRLGNNTTLRLIVCFCLFLDWAIASGRRRAWIDFEERVSRHISAVKMAMILVYWIAAFDKWNDDFLNPGTSCVQALIKGDLISSALRAWAVPQWLIYSGICATFFAEIILPFLLFFSWLRFPAVIALLFFHTALGGTFLDFSLTQIGLLCLFLPDEFLAPIFNFFAASLSKSRWLLTVALVLAIPAHFPNLLEVTSRKLVAPGLFFIVFSIAVLAALKIKGLLQVPATLNSQKPNLQWAGALILLLILVNGLSPYLGLKTYSTFSMYSNLRVQNGWNHRLFGPRFLRLFPQADDLIEIQETDEPFLSERIARRPVLITRYELERHLDSVGPSVHIAYRKWQSGQEFTKDITPLIGHKRFAWWQTKFMGFKVVHQEEKAFCEW